MHHRIRLRRVTAVLLTTALLTLVVLNLTVHTRSTSAHHRLVVTLPTTPTSTPHPVPVSSPPASPTSGPGQVPATVSVLATQWVAAYGTYRYDQPPQTYLARLAPLTDPTFLAQLQQTATSPALIQQRQRDHTIATATAQTIAVRDIQASSITVIVRGTQHLTAQGTTSTDTQDFAVTLTNSATTAGHWTVYAVQPANVGQNGDVPPSP